MLGHGVLRAFTEDCERLLVAKVQGAGSNRKPGCNDATGDGRQVRYSQNQGTHLKQLVNGEHGNVTKPFSLFSLFVCLFVFTLGAERAENSSGPPEARVPGMDLFPGAERKRRQALAGNGENAQPPSLLGTSGFQADRWLFSLQSLGQSCISPQGCGLGNVLT